MAKPDAQTVAQMAATIDKQEATIIEQQEENTRIAKLLAKAGQERDELKNAWDEDITRVVEQVNRLVKAKQAAEAALADRDAQLLSEIAFAHDALDKYGVPSAHTVKGEAQTVASSVTHRIHSLAIRHEDREVELREAATALQATINGGIMAVSAKDATIARLREATKEICICAAVWFADGPIVRGHRHDACFITAQGMTIKATQHNHVQGFITSHNRFVSREEGARLQNEAGIASAHTGKPINGVLFSEDLYLGDNDAALTPAKEADRG